MPDHTLAPPEAGQPRRPLKAVVEVTAGLVIGVPEYGYHRRFEVQGDLDAFQLREQLADRLTEAYHYAGRLPFPEVLNWVNVHAVWL